MDRPPVQRPTHPTPPITKHFQTKKGLSKSHVLKSNIPFLSQNSITGESLNWTPIGYAYASPFEG